jgi:prolipoprotein diacylglyceryltransferase
MGQILSIPFMLAGVIFIVYAVRKYKRAETIAK